MSWFSTIPAILACLLLLFIPGVIVLLSLGVKRWSLLGVAPVLTVTLVAVSAILAPYLGMTWSPLPAALLTLLLSVLLFGLRSLRRNTSGPDPDAAVMTPKLARHEALIIVAGFIAGATTIALQLHRAFGRPENISQTFDNIFHLNAVQYVLTTGNASSMTLTGMTNGDNPPYFYPAAWHGLASLLIQLTGQEISVAVNVLNLCVAAVVWTAGCMLLIRTVVGRNSYALGAAGVVAAGFGSFPLLLLDFGVLYPNFLSVSLIPATLACVAIFFGESTGLGPLGITRYALAPFATIGVAIAHPNGLMSLLALSIPLIVTAFIRYVAGRAKNNLGHARSALMGAGLLGLLALIAVLWTRIRPPAAAATWMPIQSQGQAFGEVITSSAMQRPPTWTVSILVVIGIVVFCRRFGGVWLVASFGIAGTLFIIVSAGPAGPIRDTMTGVWYNDSYRLAALLPIAAAPLAAMGVAWLVAKIHGWWAVAPALTTFLPGRVRNSRQVAPTVIAVGLFAVLLALQSKPLEVSVQSARANYALSPDAPLVSTDEMALLEELDDVVPADATIAVNPWTGGALAFAIAERNTTSKHTLTTYTRAAELLNDKLREASNAPDVCSAMQADNVRYVLDFGTKEVHGGDHGFKGLQIAPTTPGFELVAERGEARLFEVTACG